MNFVHNNEASYISSIHNLSIYEKVKIIPDVE